MGGGEFWASALLAAEEGVPTTVLGALIAALMALMALMAWVMKHIFSTTIPELTKTFNEGIKAVVDQGKVDQKGLRDLHDTRQEALLKHCQQEADREREGSERRYTGALGQLKEMHEAEMQEVRGLARTAIDQQQLLKTLVQHLTARTRLSDVVVSAEDAIWSKTLDGVILSWNSAAERLLGWRAQEMVGQSVYKVIPPDAAEVEHEALEKLRRGERVDRYETTRYHKDGRLVRVAVSVSPVKDPTGKVVGASSIAREV